MRLEKMFSTGLRASTEQKTTLRKTNISQISQIKTQSGSDSVTTMKKQENASKRVKSRNDGHNQIPFTLSSTHGDL